MNYLIAAIQMDATDNKKENMAKAEGYIKAAAKRGSKIVALPEVFLWRGSKEKQFQESETIPGPTCNYLGRLAASLGLYILGGSMLERSTRSHSYNTSILVDPSGKLIAKYRKKYLFDIAIPKKVAIRESATRKPGNRIISVATPLGIMGLSICYDLRFPELYRKLVNQGAQILFVPSAFLSTTGKAHWEILLRARAIENQCYIIAPNQVGKNTHGAKNYGNSMIIDPWGNVLAKASPNKEETIYATIDLLHLAAIRKELPSLSKI